MTDARYEAILAKIDDAVGPPETESPEQLIARRAMIERLEHANQIRKAAMAKR